MLARAFVTTDDGGKKPSGSVMRVGRISNTGTFGLEVRIRGNALSRKHFPKAREEKLHFPPWRVIYPYRVAFIVNIYIVI